MAKREKEVLAWQSIDVASLPDELKAKFDAVKACFQATKDATADFEGHAEALLVAQGVTPGVNQEFRWSYRYGLGMAFGSKSGSTPRKGALVIAPLAVGKGKIAKSA